MKKIVSSLALASILVSGLYAQQGGANCDFRKDGKNSPINQKDGKKMSKQNYGILGMFYELNLTADQKTKIDNIINESKKIKSFLVMHLLKIVLIKINLLKL